ncbi:wings apart-like protein 2 [Wolffia australiana]
MIVRTYARRSRYPEQAFSDGGSQDQGTDGHLSLSQETSSSLADPYGFAAFSSQDSSMWSFESDLLGANGLNAVPSLPPLPPRARLTGNSSKGLREIKDRDDKRLKKSEEPFSGRSSSGHSTATLMEAQEFGEMMELDDEVSFALGGLRRGQPARIRLASLLSLLSNCESAQQRRLLSARGLSKKIIDAIMGLTIDDSACSVAAAALFLVLTTDVLNDYLLDLPLSIHFLIKLLNPRVADNAGDGDSYGSLRPLGVDNVSKKLVSSSTAIMIKVQEILCSCKVLKQSLDNDVIGPPELSTTWIALLTIEKACASAVSIQDNPEAVSRVGENFKENLRKFGGLDAIFNVAAASYSRMKGRLDDKLSSSSWDSGRLDLQSLALLLKCFKIMENATFMSSDNQNHLLRMKNKSDDKGSPLSFVGLVISAIDIFSDLSLRQMYPNLSRQGFSRPSSVQSSNPRQKRPKKTCSSKLLSIGSRRSLPKSDTVGGPSTANVSSIRGSQGWISINIRKSRINSGCGPSNGSCDGSASSGSCSSRTNSLGVERRRPKVDPFAFDDDDEADPSGDLVAIIGDGSQIATDDPFAFEENEVGPTKWEILAKRKATSDRNRGVDSDNFCSYSTDEQGAGVLEECLLTAVKVLMNLTNDNPEGCRQIAACEGLDALACLIGSHFPSFDFFQAVDDRSKSVGGARSREGKHHLSDRLGLDFLVAILGLLVNLVEKDDQNRARLASARVPVSHSGGREDRDVIALLCLIFLSNRGSTEASGEEKSVSYDDEFALMQGEREAEMMIIEAYAALLLAFLSTESILSRKAIIGCLPEQKLEVLVPVLERFVAFHVSLNMISPETHQIVSEVIDSCKGA